MGSTNCSCVGKKEDWHFEKVLGCWYAIRECEVCNYYWEGPDHSKTSYGHRPTTGTVSLEVDDDSGECLRDRAGLYRVFCYDENGGYGRPMCFDIAQDLFSFIELNKYSHAQIKVTTTWDEITVEVQSGLYVYPEEWKRFNVSNE